MKTLKRGIRVWFAVLVISLGALCLRTIRAQQPIGPSGGNNDKYDDCWAALGRCNNRCTSQFRRPGSNGLALQQCYSNCDNAYDACSKRAAPAAAGAGAPGRTLPPNAQGPQPTPNPTPTNPIGVPITKNPPPNATGPNPSPSPTGNPILFDRPAQPTPSPTPKHHRTTTKKATPTPSPNSHSASLSSRDRKPTPTPSPSPHGPKSSPTPSTHPKTPGGEHHHHS